MKNTSAANTVTSVAACDGHLVRLLLQVVPEGHSKSVRVTCIKEPHGQYSCDCGIPAQWFVRELRIEELAQ